jgi:hypothetical protein
MTIDDDHDYTFTIREGDHDIPLRFRTTTEAVERIAGPAADPARVAEAALAYLLARQSAEELPGVLDLEDVAEAYDDFPAEVRARLAR